MKKILALILGLFVGFQVSSQNLIPDGGFEDVECPTNEINSFLNTPSWYALNSDAYLIDYACPLDPQIISSVLALNHGTVPFQGEAYISLEAVLSRNGFFWSEGVGIELEETLKPNHFYYFEMASMTYRWEEGLNHPSIPCEPFPAPHIEVHLSQDKIFITPWSIGFVPQQLLMNSYPALIDRSPFNRNYQWKPYWNCFEAQGGERHLAVSGNQYRLEEPNSCIEEGGELILYHFGYGVDALKLIELPKRVDSTFTICDEGERIDLVNFIEVDYFDKATFVWEDGFDGTERFIDATGIYKIDMIFPCVTIPVTLDIEALPCKAKVFVPNIFTPNFDGINDELVPQIKSDFDIVDYKFQVLDRWGQVVFSSNTVLEGWNGDVRGGPAGVGVYIWTMEYELQADTRRRFVESGDVLIRR